MAKILVALALLATAVSIGFATPAAGDFEQFKQLPGLVKVKEADLKYFFDNGPLIREWLLTLTDMDRPSRLRPNFAAPSSSPPRASLFCTACRVAMEIFLAILGAGANPDDAFNQLTAACALAGLATASECKAMVDQNAPGVLYILENTAHSSLSGSDICAVLDQASSSCGTVNSAHSDWAVALPSPRPEVQDRPVLPLDHPTAPILQITDVHLDLHYVEGSWANCDSKFLCCRTPAPAEGDGTPDVELAGPGGAYQCDAPESAVAAAITAAASKYSNYEFVMLTGDFVHHVMFEQSKADNMAHNAKVAQLMLAAFPSTPVYPVVGNHDSAPTNQFPPSSVWTAGHDVSWVYNDLADLFASQLPPAALTTLRAGGYYSVLHKPGLRLIVLNTNFGYVYNFWLFYNFKDPEGQLDWLAKTLAAAAAANENVYIIGHEPPGSDMWTTWSQQFVNVINHYQGIIRAQFYGHTHWDELRLTFDAPLRPTSVLYIGPSVTPFVDLNPAFKVYHVDGATATVDKSWEVLDHEVHSYNLSAAGTVAPGPENWTKLYNAREAYNVTNLRPTAYWDLIERMVKDKELFGRFYTNYVRKSDRSPKCDDDECRLSILCQQVTTAWEDQSRCEHLQSLLSSSSAQILPQGALLLAAYLFLAY